MLIVPLFHYMVYSTFYNLKNLVLWRSFCLFRFGMSIMIEVFSIRLSSIGSIDLPSLSFPSEQTTLLCACFSSFLPVSSSSSTAAAQCLTDHSSSPNKMPLWPPPRRPIISEKGQQGLLHHQLSLLLLANTSFPLLYNRWVYFTGAHA